MSERTSGEVEKDEPARVLLLAALSGEHGPLRTAKSELARRLRGCIAEGIYVERLLTRFSAPEELFGRPRSRGLERGECVRLTEGDVPSPSVTNRMYWGPSSRRRRERG